MVIVFDGVCNLCNGLVDFVIRRDRTGKFRFAAGQSEAAKRLLKDRGIPDSPTQTIILVDGPRWFTRSEAVLRIAAELPGWGWTRWLLGVPRIVRDAVYAGISKSRYRVWGKRESCRVPSDAERERFLE